MLRRVITLWDKSLQKLYCVESASLRGSPESCLQDKDVLIVEDAVQCVLSPYSAPSWAYHLARDYAERYDPRYGTGLIPESAPLLMDIVDFWCEYYSMNRDEL